MHIIPIYEPRGGILLHANSKGVGLSASLLCALWNKYYTCMNVLHVNWKLQYSSLSPELSRLSSPDLADRFCCVGKTHMMTTRLLTKLWFAYENHFCYVQTSLYTCIFTQLNQHIWLSMYV